MVSVPSPAVAGTRRSALWSAAKAWTTRSARGLCNLLYPPACVVCQAELPDAEQPPFVCDACRAELVETPVPLCRRCGAKVGPFVDAARGCLRCRGRHLWFDGVVRLGGYEGLRREVCLRMKLPGGEVLSAAMGELLWQQGRESLLAAAADLVVPVPLHWRRRLSRKHNPAEMVAWRLARHLRLPCLPRTVKRWRATESQSHLPPTRRLENVRGAFRARRSVPLEGLRVLLVDDVLTTGATCSETARAMRLAGAAAVTVGVIARAEGHA